MGIHPIILEKESRVGSAWLARYKTVRLHTPTYTDHYPFMKYPEDWPRWLPQDKIVQFMEQYTKAMDLDIRLGTEVTRVQYDESSCKYRVDVLCATGSQTFISRHVVLAPGIFSAEPIMPNFPDQDLFKGQTYHSKEHRSASLTADLQTKRVVIVGAGTSSHDIAQDFVNHGAKSVAMVQRGAIFSCSSSSMEKFMLPLWNTEGLTTEEADIIGSSIPTAVARTMGFGITKLICEHDKDMIASLKVAGLAVKTGEDGGSILEHQLIKTGSFYIDQGANQMIIDGRIKVHQCDGGVQQFDYDGLILADGTHVDADIIIVATGFKRMDRNVKHIMGEDVYQRCGGTKFGHMDEEQERIGVSQTCHKCMFSSACAC
jgi:cation diffusion facilitator CzcD-associated flavoprotein CzcO